jgi:fatty-acyl-CoA synthase
MVLSTQRDTAVPPSRAGAYRGTHATGSTQVNAGPEDLIATARSHSVGDIPRRSARRTPDKVAIIDGDVAMTFAEFDMTVDRAAAALRDNGFGPSDRIALLAHNCWQYAVLAFATARAPVVLVPLNFMLTAQEIAYILRHSGATGFMVEPELIPVAEAAMRAAGDGGKVVTKVALTAGQPAPAGWEDFAHWLTTTTPAPSAVVADDQLLRLMYTSGTESRPKGVMHSSRSLLWQYVSTIIAGSMTADDIEIHSMPLYHCAQLDNFLATDIYLGATSIILPRPDPQSVLRTIERYQVTNYFAPPTVWISLLRSPMFDEVNLSSLSKGYYGASPMPTQILRELRERLPNLRLWNFYGQTEIAPLASALGPDEQADHPGAAGRPVVNVETEILDESDTPVAPGTVGEIAHRSPHLMLGYLDDPVRTAEAFRGGWFHSGDLGYYDEFGLLHVVDRKKDMINTGGENVASREVEEVLYRHSGVQEVAVFGIPHPVWVEAVVAAVVVRDGVVLAEEDLIAHCRAHLAGFKTPKQVFLVDTLPKNPSGKLLKRELRTRFGAGQTAFH